jgi:hypothetical protein
MGLLKAELCLALGGGLSQSNFQQIGNGVGVQLFHDVGTVSFNGFDADTQIIGNLFVQTAGYDALKHLRFTAGEFGQ